MNDNRDNLYQQVILEEARNPNNYGELSDADVINSQYNAACGDKIQVSLKLSQDKKKVVQIKWQGSGCAISTAAMSQLSEMIKNLSVIQVLAIEPELILAKLGLSEISPARLKCLSLGLLTIKQALTSNSKRKQHV